MASDHDWLVGDDAPNAGGPLVGVRVIEMAGIGPLPLAGMLLADLGADVIRIDRPASAPPAVAGDDSVLSRGKRSISLDLKQSQDLDRALGLVDGADVFLEAFRPGVAERLGLGPSHCLQRNPRLIYGRLTGWGQDGPLATTAGHDINFLALTGVLHAMVPDAGPPLPPLNLVADYGGGAFVACFGVMTALFERQRSGLGQVVDVAMVDGVAAMMAAYCQLQGPSASPQGAGARWLTGRAHWYGTYATADGGFVSVGALEPQFYDQLLDRLGLDAADWPQWDEQQWPRLRSRLAEVFGSKTLADWSDLFEGSDACVAPVLPLGDAFSHPHMAARRTYVSSSGRYQPAPVPRFSRTPAPPLRPPVSLRTSTDDATRGHGRDRP